MSVELYIFSPILFHWKYHSYQRSARTKSYGKSVLPTFYQFSQHFKKQSEEAKALGQSIARGNVQSACACAHTTLNFSSQNCYPKLLLVPSFCLTFHREYISSWGGDQQTLNTFTPVQFSPSSFKKVSGEPIAYLLNHAQFGPEFDI